MTESDVKIVGHLLDGSVVEIVSVDDINRIGQETGHDGVARIEYIEEPRIVNVFYGRLPKTEAPASN